MRRLTKSHKLELKENELYLLGYALELRIAELRRRHARALDAIGATEDYLTTVRYALEDHTKLCNRIRKLIGKDDLK